MPDKGTLYPDDVAIEWAVQAGQSYIVIDGNTAKVSPDEDNHTVTLTATIICGSASLKKEFNITVRSVEGLFADIGEVTYTTQNGTVSASVTVKNAGAVAAYGDESFTPFDITFVAVSHNPLTGEITDRKTDVKTATSKYSKLDFEISGLTKNANDEVSYYLWDENNVPIVNNAPTEILNVTSENKIRSVNLSWEQSYDDHNALKHYAIYRDGVLIDVCTNEPVDGKITYRDGSAELLDKEEHTYKVVAVDTNELKSGFSDSVSGHTSEMPYKFEVQGLSEDKFLMEGVEIITGKTPVNEAYFEFTTAGGSPCIFTPYPTGTTRNYYTPTFKSDKSRISATTKSVVTEVTYLDKGTGTMHCIYWSTNGRKVCNNAITLQNTNQWKTAVFVMDDALFEDSASFSGGDFGFYSTDTSIYIKKVEIAKTEDY